MANEAELIAELSGVERLTVEAIARDADLPLIEVAHLYKSEREYLRENAKIPTFIPVVTAHRVRIKLKQQQETYWASSPQH